MLDHKMMKHIKMFHIRPFYAEEAVDRHLR